MASPKPRFSKGPGIPQIALVALCLLLTAGCALILSRMYSAVGARDFFRATDFRAFYSAGQIVASGRGAQLYDLHEQYSWQALVAGLDDYEQLLAYLNPPFAALPFALLSHLPLERAYALWTLINLAVFAGIGLWITYLLRGSRSTVPVAAAIMTMTFLPAFVTLVQGQWSLLLTAGLLLSWRALRDEKDIQAGLWLGVLAVKPQLLLLPIAALLWQRRWRAVGGLAASCGLALVLSWAISGFGGLSAYVALISEAARWGDRFGIHPQALYTLRGLAHAWLRTDDPIQALPFWAAGICLVIGLLWYGWRPGHYRQEPGPALQWAMLVIAALLVSPHAYNHDLSLLIVSGALVSLALTEMPTRNLTRTLLAALTPSGYLLLSFAVLTHASWRLAAVQIFLVVALAILAISAPHFYFRTD